MDSSVDQGYVVRYNYKERFNTNNHLSSYLNRKSVLSVAVDKERNLWMATMIDGLYVYNMDSHEVKEVDSAGLPGKSATDKPDITRVFVDDEGYIWLAALYASKVMKCSYKNGILKTESIHDIFLPLSFAQDRCGTIWVGTYSPKLYAKKRKEKEFVQTKVFSWTGTFIPGLLPRNNGKMWTTAS